MLVVLFLTLLVLLYVFGCLDIHYHRAPKENKIRIACIGDSITNGFRIRFNDFNAYPATLEEILGPKKYHVENYGLNDRDAQSFGNKPYGKTAQYKKSQAFMPDYIVAMLGTNDTKYWKDKETFKAEFRALLAPYKDLETNPQIVLCTPPKARTPKDKLNGLFNDCVKEHLPSVAQAVSELAKEDGYLLVDLYGASADLTDIYAGDGLHMNKKGAHFIANEVATALRREK